MGGCDVRGGAQEILGELVRRVTGKRIERFLLEDVLEPARLADLRLGVPAEEVPLLARSRFAGLGSGVRSACIERRSDAPLG